VEKNVSLCKFEIKRKINHSSFHRCKKFRITKTITNNMTFFVDLRLHVPGMEGLECKNWGKMSVMDTIFGRWKLAVTEDIYIRSRSNIGAQTFKVHRPTIHISTGFLNIVWEYFYFNGP
jgi:hypothetical protein